MKNINTNEFMQDYSNIVFDLNKIRNRQEDLLTDIVKKYQKSSEEGIDIRELRILVDLDGYEKHLVHGIRAISDDDMGDCIELKIQSVSPNEFEWIIISDFYSDTAGAILFEIMENL